MNTLIASTIIIKYIGIEVTVQLKIRIVSIRTRIIPGSTRSIIDLNLSCLDIYEPPILIYCTIIINDKPV